jgi:signal transduction histidine kinase
VVVAHAASAFGAVGSVIARRTSDGDHIELLGADGMPPAVAEEWRRFPVTAPVPLAHVARTGEALFLESREDWQRHFPELLASAEEIGHHANVVLPLTVDGAPVGALGVAFDAPRVLDAEEHALAFNVARQCALALERARLLEAERTARAEADLANQAKTHFLATMSHELRTPLNAIGGYAQLIEMGVYGTVTEEQREALARIQRSKDHLLGLVSNLLNLTRLGAGHVEFRIEDVPLEQALDFVSDATAPQRRAKSLRYELSGGAGLVVRADVDKLRQILLNLLANAIKFTEPEGRIGVSCSAEDHRIRIAVSDTGRGIHASQLEKIFDPFVQLDRRLNRPIEGVGLGLAISRELARGMGGELSVSSVPGVGSTFALTLPAA